MIKEKTLRFREMLVNSMNNLEKNSPTTDIQKLMVAQAAFILESFEKIIFPSMSDEVWREIERECQPSIEMANQEDWMPVSELRNMFVDPSSGKRLEHGFFVSRIQQEPDLFTGVAKRVAKTWYVRPKAFIKQMEKFPFSKSTRAVSFFLHRAEQILEGTCSRD